MSAHVMSTKYDILCVVDDLCSFSAMTPLIWHDKGHLVHSVTTHQQNFRHQYSHHHITQDKGHVTNLHLIIFMLLCFITK